MAQPERTYDFEIDTHNMQIDSSISANNIGQAIQKLLVSFEEDFNIELEQSEITFIGDRPNNGERKK
jgi:hypothetical protein